MILDKVDLSKALTKEQYAKKLTDLQARMRELEFRIYRKRVPVVIAFEGWDAAGKGGNIKRLTESLDPRGYTVHSYAAPEGEEKTHQYLWRFWRDIPKAGHIAVFDRSWYGRVLVERIEGFCKPDDWKRAFTEINDFESQLASFGTVVLKFWIHISQEEQESRFRLRETDAFKNYKLTDEDWRNREKWAAYEEAVDEMIVRTGKTHAPWHVVPGNNKYFARIFVLETVTEAIEARLQ